MLGTLLEYVFWTALFVILLLVAINYLKGWYNMKNSKITSDTTVLVTGGCMGIGNLMAENFARRNKCKLIILDIRTDLAQEVVTKMRSFGSTVSFYKCDVSNSQEVKTVCSKIKEEFGFVDILINNAGIVYAKDFDSTSIDQYHQAFDVNYFGCIHLLKQFLPLMKQKNKGHIVTISSVMSQMYTNGSSEYISSKWALFALHSSLRMELKKENFNIATTVVCPYHITTGMFKDFKMWKCFGLLESLKPETVAEAVYFAILKKKEELFIYWYLPILLKIFYMVPTFITDRITLLMGGNALANSTSTIDLKPKKEN